jgi:hypothetical protein
VLFDPVLNERIAQSMFGLAFTQVGAFHDQAVFAAFLVRHVEKNVRQRADGMSAAVNETIAGLSAVMNCNQCWQAFWL